ncbi:MAG: hypothetical protein AAF772_19460 [Acidobacteriota bacterium]
MTASLPDTSRDDALALIATCSRGLEPFVARELVALGLRDDAPPRPEAYAPGAVTFRGRWPDVWRANLALRTANRVLVELAAGPADDADALYRLAHRTAGGIRRWDDLPAGALFDPDATLAVHASQRRGGDTGEGANPRWMALKVKDGVVDAQRERFGRRADVDRHDADRVLRIHVDGDRATLLLDTSGAPLDRRGYRLSRTEAPLRETLAAACALAARDLGPSGGERFDPACLFDPMCGTGTLLAEAAWLYGNRAPGLLRAAALQDGRGEGWAFTRLPNFDARAFDRLVDDLRDRVRSGGLPPIVGIDRDGQALRAASDNLARAGLDERAELAQGSAFEVAPPAASGLLLVNPPYGHRIDMTEGEWRQLGDRLKRRFAGWRAVVIAGDEKRGGHIGLRPTRKLTVHNGPIKARILVFDLY